MDECELITFISATACAISKCCSTDELTILAVVFTQLGDTLATILAKRDLVNPSAGDAGNNGCPGNNSNKNQGNQGNQCNQGNQGMK
jgi:hypothetical protein